eukprot:scaffold24728_cov32-Tisochrysis_lutea.AAC.2
MSCRRVCARTKRMARSFASVPELTKKTVESSSGIVAGGELARGGGDHARVAVPHVCHVVDAVEVSHAVYVEEKCSLSPHQVERPRCTPLVVKPL